MSELLAEPAARAGALFAVGAVAGAINVLAGGGSFLTLPTMIFLGLPPSVANGTNRVAILVQNVGAVASFHRHRIVEWPLLGRAAIPTIVGAGLGSWAGVEIGEEAFRRILALLMVGVALWTIWDPLERMRGDGPGDAPSGESTGRWRTAGLALAFLGVGFYGGFVQAGAGFLILAVTTAVGLDLVRGNALKVALVLAYTPLALGLFAASGKVDWRLGTALAAGNLVGGLAGVRLTVLKGHDWIKKVVTVTVVAFAIRLWIG
ncbi:MAG: sulfite exporter TauE/SafE family protein [Gemmatimonadota bacterium]|nr:sulfite exporter TauE/SafE family protein [Gemmatimonadota bacterium]